MKKWASTFALAGAVWMPIVLSFGPLSLTNISNYPGVFSSRWGSVQRNCSFIRDALGIQYWMVLDPRRMMTYPDRFSASTSVAQPDDQNGHPNEV